MPQHKIESRAPLTAAQTILSTLSIEGIDTASAPGVAKRRLRGDILLQAIQRRIQEITTYAADGAITIQSGVHKITKGSAAALTLAAPTAAQEGTELQIISNSAFAHVITVTAGVIQDGAGAARVTATFANVAGASLRLIAINLKWSVVANNNVTMGN